MIDRTSGQAPLAFPIVVVHWEDASNVAQWADLEDAQAFENVDFDYHCTNVGYLIRDDEECVVLAARAAGEFTQVGLIERIPRGMVQRVEILVAESIVDFDVDEALGNLP